MPTTIETLNIPNFSSANIVDELELSADAAAAQAVIPVINVATTADADYLVLNPGEETSELRQVGTGGVSGQNITVSSNLSLQHRNHERLIKVFGDKVKVYRAPNVDGTIPADTAFTALGSATIKPDQPFTSYIDSAGGNGFWYKFVYLNSTNSNETDISQSEAIRGGSWGHYVSIDDIRSEAGVLDTRRLSDTQISTRRAEAESEIKGALSSAGYILPLQTSAGVYYTPPVIENIARMLSAGYVLMQNFGVTKPSSAKDGKSKIDIASGKLQSIKDNKTVLLDTNEQMLAKPGLLDGWPDDTTATVGTDGVHPEPARATMSKVF